MHVGVGKALRVMLRLNEEVFSLGRRSVSVGVLRTLGDLESSKWRAWQLKRVYRSRHGLQATFGLYSTFCLSRGGL